MPAIQQIALAVVVAAPVVVIAAVNVFLFLKGERGTLLFPHLGNFPRIDAQPESEVPFAAVPESAIVIAEEPLLREAA